MSEIRTEKAERLVNHGAVEILRTTILFTEAFVRGDHGPQATIIYRNGRFYCTCDWGRLHPYTTKLCAHALAVRLVVQREAGQAESLCQTLDNQDRVC